MGSILDRIFGKSEEPLNSASLRAEIAKAEAAETAARAAVERAREGYRASLLDADPEVTTAAKVALDRAEVEADRAAALPPILRERFREACEEEAEAERRAIYDDALAAKAQAAAALRKYPAAAEAVVEILSALARAEVEIASANRNLPADAEPITSPEADVRFGAAIPQKSLGERVEDSGWHYLSNFNGSKVEDHLVGQIEPRHPGARIGTVTTRGELTGTRTHVVVRRRKRIRTWLQAIGGDPQDALSHAVRLPAARYGEAPIWPGAGPSRMANPDPAAGAPAVLQAADELAEARRRKPVDQRLENRIPQSSESLVDEPELLAEAERFARERADA